MLTFSLAALNYPDYSFCTKPFLSAAAVVTTLCVMIGLSLLIDLEGVAINYSLHYLLL